MTIKECIKRYREKNREKAKKCSKEWRRGHKEQKLEVSRQWRKNNQEKSNIINRRHNTKRKRNLGYNLLNEKFPGSVGHHINRNDIIFIPEELHKSIPHRQEDEKSMNEINTLALEYLITEVENE